MPATDKAYKSARRLRRSMSLPEVFLWRLVRTARPRIRRQHPIGTYVLDFYCPSARLVIEIDGFAHDTADRPQRDIARDAWLETQGLRVLRIPAADVLREPEACADAIMRLCQTPPPQR